MNFKEIVKSILFVIILAFVFVFIQFLFKKIFIEQNVNYISEGIGAFMGAFFAFLFLRIGESLNRLYTRRRKRYTALAKLEQICNEYLTIISENQAQLEDFIRTLESKALFGNQLQTFYIDRTIPLNLTNADLINEAFILSMEARRLNESIEIVYSRYKTLERDFRNKLISEENLSKNVRVLLPRIKDLVKFHKGFYAKTINILAKVRILLRKEWLNEISIDRERARIVKEIEKIKEKSAQEIENLLSQRLNNK